MGGMCNHKYELEAVGGVYLTGAYVCHLCSHRVSMTDEQFHQHAQYPRHYQASENSVELKSSQEEMNTTDSATSTVLLVDDHPLMRKGIRTVLEGFEDLRVIGEASNGLEAVQYARQLRPSVIVMDINMPHMDGVQATRLIKEEQPAVTIIGLSVDDAVAVRQAMMEAGATTSLHKEDVGDDLYGTIRRIMEAPSP